MWTSAHSRNWYVESAGSLPWRAETHKSCLIFKDSLLKAQEQSILMFRMLSRYSRRPPWLNRELLTDFKCKKEEYGGGSGDKQPKRNTETLPGHVGIELGKSKLSRSWN